MVTGVADEMSVVVISSSDGVVVTSCVDIC